MMNERFLHYFCGVSGTGKSYLIKNKIIPQMNTGKRPVLVFDKQGEYAGPGAKDIPTGANWNNYRGVEKFGEMLAGNGNVIPNEVHVIQSWRPKDYLLIPMLKNRSEKEYRKTGKLYPFSIVLDETRELFSSADYTVIKQALIDVARAGRKFHIDFVLISQRTIDVPPDVRSQFRNNVTSFNQTLESDIKTLERLGCENAERVLDLKQREYQVFGELPEHINLN